MDAALSGSTLAGYALSAVVFILHLVSRRDVFARLGAWMLLGACALHTAQMGVRWWLLGVAPATTLAEALSFFGWFSAGGFLLLQLKHRRLRSVGAIVAGFATLIVSVAVFLAYERETLAALSSPWLPVHVLVAVLGYAALFLAFFASVAYLLQERSVKRKRLGPLHVRLPALETLDHVNHRCVIVGLPLLTLGIVTGALLAKAKLGDYWPWEWRQVWLVATWITFAGVLLARVTAGWRGKRTAILTIVGVAVMLGSLLGVSVGFHETFR
jgi:cytochrome c-type biogenesis protein CcsB